MKKRGSLNLSINAIVVLILAITMLGLGLGFMRNIFGGAVDEFSRVKGTVEKQMVDQMKESNKIVDISRPKVNLKIGEKDSVYIGFKNDQADPVDFEILPPGSGGLECAKLGSSGDCNAEPGMEDVWLEFKQGDTEVLAGDVFVMPINVKSSPSARNENTFFFTIKVRTTDSSGSELEKRVELTVDLTV